MTWAKYKPTKEQARRYDQTRGLKVRQLIQAIKAQPCTDCGVQYPPCAMDFDHVRGDKLINVSHCRSIKRALAEIAKCEVVCANCHRIRTYMRKQGTLNVSAN